MIRLWDYISGELLSESPMDKHAKYTLTDIL
jgi:hypothetical protein